MARKVSPQKVSGKKLTKKRARKPSLLRAPTVMS